MRPSVVTILLGAAVIAAACGASQGAAAPVDPASRADTSAATPAAAKAGPRPTACTLVSQEEMSGILGGAVPPPQGNEGADTTICRYSPAAENAIAPYAHVDIDWDAGEEAMAAGRIAAS